MDITKRHRQIINAVVDMYITAREPIASAALLDHLELAVSSATLRSEMATLTKLGFLNQPHVSAGRVPTNKAYRYYLENFNTPKGLSVEEMEYIKSQFDMLDHDSQRFFQGAAQLFSQLFSVTTVITPPFDTDLKFVNFNVLQTGKYNVVLIGVTALGDVHTRVIKVTNEVKHSELEQLKSLLNSRLCFICWDDIDIKYFDNLCEEIAKENPSYSQIIKASIALIKTANTQNIHVRGEEFLLKTNEFDLNIADILKLLANHELLKDIITPTLDGVLVVYGDEMPISNIDNVCFISTRYSAVSAISGAFCVVCPQAVDYEKLFSSVQYFAQLLTQTITGTERKK